MCMLSYNIIVGIMSFISEMDEEEDMSSIRSDESLTDPETSDEDFLENNKRQCARCLRADETGEEIRPEPMRLLLERLRLAVSVC